MERKRRDKLGFAGGLAGGCVVSALEAVEMIPHTAWMIVFAISAMIVIYCVVEYFTGGSGEDEVRPEPPEGSVERVSEKDRILIKRMASLMDTNHGHKDVVGLLADRASGIPLNELMERKCSVCGKLRKKKFKKEDVV